MGDDGAINPIGSSKDDIWCAQRANGLALHFHRPAGVNISLDDTALGENAAACVCVGGVRTTVEVAVGGLHVGAASAQLRAARVDQKRNGNPCCLDLRSSAAALSAMQLVRPGSSLVARHEL